MKSLEEQIINAHEARVLVSGYLQSKHGEVLCSIFSRIREQSNRGISTLVYTEEQSLVDEVKDSICSYLLKFGYTAHRSTDGKLYISWENV